MKCVICNNTIEKYNQEFNQLKLDENKTVEICSDCIQKFTQWQQGIFAKIYPTTFIKRLTKKNKKINM